MKWFFFSCMRRMYHTATNLCGDESKLCFAYIEYYIIYKQTLVYPIKINDNCSHCKLCKCHVIEKEE